MSIFVISDPLLDILANVPDLKLYEKYNLRQGDSILADESHKGLYQDLLQQPSVKCIPGGSALNSARATNFMLRHQGMEEKITYFGSIGRDEYGKILENSLSDNKIKGLFYKDSGLQTGTCGVVVYKNNRSLVANLSAAQAYNHKHFEDNFKELEAAKLIYTVAYFINASNETLSRIGQYAVANDVPMAFNLSAEFLIEQKTAQVDAAIENSDFVFANEDEASTWGRVKKLHSTDRRDIALSMAKYKK